MDLPTARAVQQEIEALFATRDLISRRRRFAVGLALSADPTQVAIAIRAVSEAELSRTDLSLITQRAQNAGGEVDVHYTGAITPISKATTASLADTLGIGSSVAHRRCSAGTLGFFARRRTPVHELGFVSNNHVLALCDEGVEGDEVVHPSPSDGGVSVVGRLVANYPRIRETRPRVDCAFARLVPDIPIDPETIESRTKVSRQIVLPELGLDVSKVGRSTGLTDGVIAAVNLNGVPVEYGFSRLYFDGQIEIRSVDSSMFSKDGDSGSLVFSRSGQHPVGLLFACSATGRTYANNIGDVLQALDVEFA